MIVEIFKAGTHTDSKGFTKTWTTEELDLIVQKYQEQLKENQKAPVVIGHPKDNAPAYGWIEEVKRIGDKLVAKIQPTVNEFVEAVKKGLYRNVSISLYPDYRIRHLGFLGAVPPAVKGLSILSFNEGEEYQEYQIDFSETTTETTETTEEVTKEVSEESSEGGEEDMTEKFKQELEEKEKALQELQAKLKQLEDEKKKAEFKEFAEKLEKEDKITPALKDKVVEILFTAYSYSYEFSESDNLVKQLKEFLEALPSLKLTGEFATDDKAQVDTSDFSDPAKLTGWDLVKLYKENPEKYNQIRKILVGG